MHNHNSARILHESEVVSLQNTNNFLISHSTFKVDEFFAAIQRHLGKQEKWFTEGVECEILAPGTVWQKGRVRIQLEFYPEAIEELVIDASLSNQLETENKHDAQAQSPLEEIRLMMTENK